MVDKIKSEIPDAVQTYFNKSSLYITPSTRMIVNIKKQLTNMLPKAKRERAKGGKSYKRILACWEIDWLKLTIYIHELDKPGAMKLLQDADSEKRKLLEEEMTMHKQTVDNLKLRIGELETKNNDLKLKVTKLLGEKYGKTGRGASKRVHDDLSTRQMKRMCLKMQELSKTSLQFLEGYNFKSVKLELYNGNTDRFETIDVMGIEVCSKRKTDLSNNVADKINMALLIKDKFCLSDKAYMELSTLSEDMPSL